MLGHIVFLSVAYVFLTRGAALENNKEDYVCGNRGSPLTDHLLKFLNHFDDSIIGFHLVVPRDDLIMNNYSERPQVSKILEYVTQINYLRNMIENDPEVSLKRSDKSWNCKSTMTTPSNLANTTDPHHTDILIFSQLSPQRTEGVQLNASKKNEGESVIFVPYPRNFESRQNGYQNITSDILSRAVGCRLNGSSDHRTRSSPRASKISNYTILKKFEDGIRVYPLISVSQRNDSIDCITGKVNRSQQDICLMGRIRRKLSTEMNRPNGCAFLVKPLVSSNPSLIMVPKSVDNMYSSKLPQPTLKETDFSNKDRKTFVSSKETNQFTKDLGNISMNSKVCNTADEVMKHTMTFLAPLLDSAIVLPLKTGNDALENCRNSMEQLENKYLAYSLMKRSAPNADRSNLDRDYDYGELPNNDAVSRANLYNIVSNVSGDVNDSTVNRFTGACNDDSSFSFADILRQSIADLVYGEHPGSPDDSCDENIRAKTSNTRLNDFTVYLLLDSEKNDSTTAAQSNCDNSSCGMSDLQSLFSCPKSKTFKGFDDVNFACFNNRWSSPTLERDNKTDCEVPIKNIFSTNFHENDAFNNMNSLYKERIEHILSYAKKGRYGFYGIKRRRDSDLSDKADTFSDRFVVKDEVGVCDRYDLVSERTKRAVESTTLPDPKTNRDKENSGTAASTCSDTPVEQLGRLWERSGLVSQSQYPNLKKKTAGRINRSLGRILMIPQVDRNLDLLIVYPYSARNNKKTIVSKSVKKYSSERRKKPLSDINNVLQRIGSTTKKPEFKIQLDKKFYNELTKQKSSKSDPTYKVKCDQRLADPGRTISYYGRNDVDSDMTSKYYNLNPINLTPSKYSISNFADAVSQNLSYTSAMEQMKMANASDFPEEKSFRNGSVPAFISDEMADSVNSSEPWEARNDLTLLQNLTETATMNAMKIMQSAPSGIEASNNSFNIPQHLGFFNTNYSEPFNSTGFPNAFHTTNGFKVSNATNLLIKLTELKGPLENSRLRTTSDVLGTEQPKLVGVTTELAVTGGLMLMQNTSETPILTSCKKNMNVSDIVIDPLFKGAKMYSSSLISNETKVVKIVSEGDQANPDLQVSPHVNVIKFSQFNNESVNINSTVEENPPPPKNDATLSKGLMMAAADKRICDPTVAQKTVTETAATSEETTSRPVVSSTVSSTCEVDESTEEPEDADIGPGYPEFTPVISVNIFPILGSWRRPQIEATSLIKELFRATQKLKVEEEELPTYLSELFDSAEENKTQHKNVKGDTTQRKLTDILSGHSVNDILKLKLQNILQLSTKPKKSNSKKDDI